MSLRQELLKATGVKGVEGQPEEELVLSVAQKIAEMGEDEWAKLSDSAQAFYNQVVDASEKGEPVPPFPSDDDSVGVTEVTKEEEEVAKKKSGEKKVDKAVKKAEVSKGSVGDGAAKEPAGEKKGTRAPAKVDVKARAEKRNKTRSLLLDLVLKNPSAGLKELKQKLPIAGLDLKKRGQSVMLAPIFSVITLLRDKGVLKK